MPTPSEFVRGEWVSKQGVRLLWGIRHARSEALSGWRMKAMAVNRAVNSVKNDNETCNEPIGEPPLEGESMT